MAKITKKKDKLPLTEIIRNTFFMIRYAVRLDKFFMICYFSVVCIGFVINTLFDTVILKGIIDRLYNNTPINDLIIYIIIGTLLATLAEILTECLEHVNHIRLIDFTGRVQQELLAKTAKIDLICYDHKEYFDDFVIATSQCEIMLQQAIGCVTYLIGNALAIITASAFISTINPVVAIFPVLGFIVNIITRFSITKLEYEFELAQKKIRRKSDYSRRVFYQPEYAKEIKLTNIFIPLHKQFEDAIKEEQAAARKYGIKIAILSLVNWIVVFTFLSYFCIPMYLGYLALVKLSISLGDVASLNNAANTIGNRLDGTNYALVYFQRVGLYADRFRKFIDYKVNIEEAKGTATVPATLQPLEINHLTYRYDGADHDSLHDVSLSIKPGEKIAIVGENGAGKTTFVKLLMHLYNPTTGEIRYGNYNINEFNTLEYRDKIGAVFQDYQIYAATLAENVLMRECRKEDEAIVLKALESADFSNKLKKLDHGIHTELTREFNEDGSLLSGGEAQKVAIARLFAKTTHLSLAILDEPSSALDPIAEYTLNTNIMELCKHSSIIFISHRLSTTRDADRIYMFEHGQIIEQGTHAELMALDGQYAKMFEKQAKNYKLKSM
ncbi:MAG: ABC transporter ATP-binding protein [bacterium]|nr:ABC transporter ATP-binding protein [bacterium]